jgi:hypothetical protein
MKVIELVTELWKQPMMAEIIWLDEHVGYSAEVVTVHLEQVEGLRPPVVYLEPEPVISRNTMVCEHGLKPGECSACEPTKDCEVES